jgi:hypothetical protein
MCRNSSNGRCGSAAIVRGFNEPYIVRGFLSSPEALQRTYPVVHADALEGCRTCHEHDFRRLLFGGSNEKPQYSYGFTRSYAHTARPGPSESRVFHVEARFDVSNFDI